jgi:Flp pilus assembly pilin Flp
MNESVENKPVELSQEETKEVVGGATSIEYGLIAAGIAKEIVTVVAAEGKALAGKFSAIQAKLK